MKFGLGLLSLGILLGVAGCSKTYSVDDLKQDPALLKQVIQKCSSGKLKEDSENCKNALQAEAENEEKSADDYIKQATGKLNPVFSK